MAAVCVALICPLSAGAEGNRWLSKGRPLDEYAYSFAFVGDTQIVAQRHTEEFPKIYDHIVSVAKEKNLKHVFGLGDITDNDSYYEWEVADTSVKKLQGVVPYTLLRGNHDGGGNFLLYMTNKKYMDQFDEIYDSCVLNCYMTTNVGTIKYLFLCLDYCAGDEVLKWANGVIADHPDHNVIITTHAYLSRYGKPLTLSDLNREESSPSFNCGQEMWDELVKKHKNVSMVVSGHIDVEDIIVSTQKGDFGNVVTQVLIDPQSIDVSDGPTGLIAFFHFSRDGKRVQVEYYSPIKDMYFKEKNQMTLEVNCIGGDAYDRPIVEQIADILPADADFNEEKFFDAIGIAMLVITAVAMFLIISIKQKGHR